MKFVLSPRCAAHRGDNFVIEYLDEIKTEFENTVACLSVAQMGSNYENHKSVFFKGIYVKVYSRTCRFS